jgi:hypothetical protein
MRFAVQNQGVKPAASVSRQCEAQQLGGPSADLGVTVLRRLATRRSGSIPQITRRG